MEALVSQGCVVVKTDRSRRYIGQSFTKITKTNIITKAKVGQVVSVSTAPLQSSDYKLLCLGEGGTRDRGHSF